MLSNYWKGWRNGSQGRGSYTPKGKIQESISWIIVSHWRVTLNCGVWGIMQSPLSVYLRPSTSPTSHRLLRLKDSKLTPCWQEILGLWLSGFWPLRCNGEHWGGEVKVRRWWLIERSFNQHLFCARNCSSGTRVNKESKYPLHGVTFNCGRLNELMY